MAKKKQNNKFADIVDGLQEFIPDAAIASEDEYAEIKNWVSLGNYMLNAQISGSIFKGIPEGRMLLLAGDPGTGKTFLALNACREAQKRHNSFIFWLDSEGAMDKATMERIGIDSSMASIINVGNINLASRTMLNVLSKLDGKKSCEAMIVLDSIGNLTSTKEEADLFSGNEKRDMTKQQHIKAMFRTVLTKLRTKRIPMVATTHVYDSIGSYIPMKNISGGTGHQFGSSITLMLSKKKLKADKDRAANRKGITEKELELQKDKKNQTGVVITSTQEKARYTKGGIPVTLHVSFYKGMNRFVGLEEFLDYETMGVGPGKLVEQKVEKEVDGEKKKVKELVYDPHTKKSAPLSWAIEELGQHVKSTEFWKHARVIFTKENLKKLDEKIRPIFEFPEYEDDYDTIVEGYMDDGDDS